jgi:hypothetical protein
MDDNLVRCEPLLGISFCPMGHFRITDHSAETRENAIKLSLFFNPFLMVNIQPIRCQLNYVYSCEREGVQRVLFLSDVTEKIAKNVHAITHCFGHAKTWLKLKCSIILIKRTCATLSIPLEN